LTRRLYNPLKVIMDKTRRRFGEHTGESGEASGYSNEYAQINSLIDNLSGKVVSLETTLQSNLPLMKSKLVSDLLEGRVESQQELGDRFDLLPYKLPKDMHYSFILLELDQALMSSISVENQQFLIYSLIDQLDELKHADLFCMAGEASSTYQVHAFLCTDDSDAELLISKLSPIRNYFAMNYHITMKLLIGPWKTDPLQVNQAYKASEGMFEYAYFNPSQDLFIYEELIVRENYREPIRMELLEQYAEALKAKRPERAKDSLSLVIGELKSGTFSADYSHQLLREIVYIYYKFVKDMHMSTRDIIPSEPFTEFENIRNVEEFEKWKLEVLDLTFEYIEQSNRGKNSTLISTVKDYVSSHLAEDLSLEVVAGVVFLSPRYLSKIFKQDTGENFVEFVTKERMNAAAHLIASTDETIETIAQQVGYNNPAYFTKRFKETFGATPTAYRAKQ